MAEESDRPMLQIGSLSHQDSTRREDERHSGVSRHGDKGAGRCPSGFARIAWAGSLAGWAPARLDHGLTRGCGGWAGTRSG